MLPAVAGCVRPRRQDPLIVELAHIERTARAGEEVRQRAMAALAAAVNGTASDPTLRGVKEAFAPLAITNDDARSIVASLGGGQVEPNAGPRRRRSRSRRARHAGG